MTVPAISDTLAIITACHDASVLTDDVIRFMTVSPMASPTFIPITRERGLMFTVYHGSQSQVTSGKEHQSIKGRTCRACLATNMKILSQASRPAAKLVYRKKRVEAPQDNSRKR